MQGQRNGTGSQCKGELLFFELHKGIFKFSQLKPKFCFSVQTAYFAIPEGTPHGSDLICSHQFCREQGVKFQFCAYCQCPVAKRNFRNRHLHIDDAYPNIGPPAAVMKKRDICQPISQGEQKKLKLEPGIITTDPPLLTQQPRQESNDGDNEDSSSEESEDKIGRERQWTQLLHNRPPGSDERALELWIQKVMEVSRPLDSGNEDESNAKELLRNQFKK